MARQLQQYHRFCPGEEQISISDAICMGRRRSNFAKCPGCQFNDDERGRPTHESTLIGQQRVSPTMIPRKEEEMVEKVFKAYDVRATYPEPLNEDIAWRIGNATAQFLRTTLTGYDRSDPEMGVLVVGRDMRKSSPSLCRAFIEGVVASGTAVVDIGMIDTSQIAFAANHLKCCGGVQTTASHNPANYNGFKISGLKGKPIGADSGLKEIERIARAISRHKVTATDQVRTLDLSQPYRDYVRKHLQPLNRPLKIVVDASNGMAGRWFPILFSDTPNLQTIALNFEHDGEFVHPPNPLVPANLAQLRAAVRAHKADLGACFDGDADRCMFVDSDANIVACDHLTALLAEEFLRSSPGSTVVYDLRSSRIVKERILACGGTPKRQRVGHVFMKRAMAETGAVFGGELSGHFYFRDFWNCDSGFLNFVAVLNVLNRTGRPLGELLRPLQKYPASGELNFENPDKEGTIQALATRYSDAEVDSLDGITVQYPTWWFNVRASNTEPLLRLNMEADTPELLQSKLAELKPLLGHEAEGH